MEQDNLPLLKLDNIQEQVKLSNGKATQLMETCIWCLLHCEHSNGVKLRVENTNKNNNVPKSSDKEIKKVVL